LAEHRFVMTVVDLRLVAAAMLRVASAMLVGALWCGAGVFLVLSVLVVLALHL
jgi:hypothetical protein